jgi:hypothetical protein
MVDRTAGARPVGTYITLNESPSPTKTSPKKALHMLKTLEKEGVVPNGTATKAAAETLARLDPAEARRFVLSLIEDAKPAKAQGWTKQATIAPVKTPKAGWGATSKVGISEQLLTKAR